MKICVVIPTYNESKTIKNIIRQLSEQGLYILIIDDGSTDNTDVIASESGAEVLRNEKNQGKGKSLIRAFKHIERYDFEAIVTMDGDAQHLPGEIPKFIEHAVNNNANFIIGNRMNNANKMPFTRRITNRVMSALLSTLSRQNIPDSQCGFRFIRKSVLKNLNLESSNYEIESEMILKASRNGIKIESLPIETIYSGSDSHINPVKDTIRFFKFIFKSIWTR